MQKQMTKVRTKSVTIEGIDEPHRTQNLPLPPTEQTHASSLKAENGVIIVDQPRSTQKLHLLPVVT